MSVWQTEHTMAHQEERDSSSQTMAWDDYGFESWTDEQLLTIDENVEYHKEMLQVWSQLKEAGPSDQGKLPKLPTAPKRKLKNLYEGKTKAAKKDRSPQELHEYLKSKIVDTTPTFEKEGFSFNVSASDLTSSADAIQTLKDGNTHIQRHNATSTSFYLQYGSLLNATFNLHKAESSTKSQQDRTTWVQWLKESDIGISESTDRRLRGMFCLLEPYMARFSSIGLSFFEIMGMKNEIRDMMAHSNEIKDFWTTDCGVDPDNQ